MNYEIITKDLLNIINIIEDYQFDIKNNENNSKELIEKAKKDTIDCYSNFQRAKDRLYDIEKLMDLKDSEGFKCFAIINLLNAKSRIDHFLETSQLQYPKKVYDIYKHNTLLIPDVNVYSKECEKNYDKFYHINYRRVMINYGLIESIKDVKESIELSLDIEDKETQYKILENMEEMAKTLDGYIEDY